MTDSKIHDMRINLPAQPTFPLGQPLVPGLLWTGRRKPICSPSLTYFTGYGTEFRQTSHYPMSTTGFVFYIFFRICPYAHMDQKWAYGRMQKNMAKWGIP